MRTAIAAAVGLVVVLSGPSLARQRIPPPAGVRPPGVRARVAAPEDVTYSVADEASQNDHVEGAPFGTRGGLSVVHVFPADADYVFRIEFVRAAPGGGFVGGVSREEQVEISIDGDRVALIAVDPFLAGTGPEAMAMRADPMRVPSGPHRVSAAFIARSEGPAADLISPRRWSLAEVDPTKAGYGLTVAPRLRSVVIGGPFDATGASRARAVPVRSPVADASMRGDVGAVRALLRSGAEVNTAQGDGMTALHWAARLGSTDLVVLLLGAGASVDPRTRIGAYTPLHLASRGGWVDVVRLLLAAGADDSALTSTGGATPLHLAAASGSALTVAALLDHGANVAARESAWGQTPLAFAAALGHVEVIRLLLARGASASSTDRVIDLPSFVAADRVAKLARDWVLIAYWNRSGAPMGWTATPAQEQDAVRSAVAVQRAAAAGAALADDLVPQSSSADDVAAYAAGVGGWGGLTPLLYAAREGRLDAVEALLDRGADANQRSAGDGTSALLIASINGNYDVVLALLRRGADPNLAAENGAAPLYAVLDDYWSSGARSARRADAPSQAGYLETMAALLAAGADPNARLARHVWYSGYAPSRTAADAGVDTTGETTFQRAARAGDDDAMRLLIRSGADPGSAR